MIGNDEYFLYVVDPPLSKLAHLVESLIGIVPTKVGTLPVSYKKPIVEREHGVAEVLQEIPQVMGIVNNRFQQVG